MQKCDIFFRFKMAAVLLNIEQLGQHFALHLGTTQDMCLQNIIGISVMRALGPGQCIDKHIDDPSTSAAAAASNLSNTYRPHTSCGT